MLNKDGINNKQNRLEEERLKRGWSMAELAREARVSQRTISRAESGNTLTKLTKSKIANGLNTSIEKLFPEI